MWSNPPYRGTGYSHPYANDEAIRAILEASPRRLVVLCGHDRGGHALATVNGVTYVTARAMCERPYSYYVLDFEGPALAIQERALAN